MGTTTTTTGARIKGGSFLIESRSPDEIFTPEDLSDQHKLIAQTAAEFVEREIVPRVKEIEEKKPGLLRELLQKAADVGLCAIDVSAKYGGLELDKISSIIVAEKMARNGSWAVTLGSQAGIGILPIAFFGTEEQKMKYVPKLASAEWVGAYALSEAGSASDALNVKTRATLSADGRFYILNGTKMWITNGGIADVYVVFAKVDGEKFTAFIVERSFPGVSPGAEEHKMGIRGSSTTPLNLENVPVPVENVLGEIGKGHQIAFNILNVGRLKLGAGCVGGAKYLLVEALRWAKQRTAFGHPIADFQGLQWMLADMRTRIEAARMLTWQAAALKDAHKAHSQQASNDRAVARRRSPGCAYGGRRDAGGAPGVRRGVLHPEGDGHRSPRLHRRRERADFRRLRLFERVRSRARLPRPARQPDFRRHQRNQPPADRGHAPQALDERPARVDSRGREARR